MPDFVGIGLMTDGDQTGTPSAADFVLYPMLGYCWRINVRKPESGLGNVMPPAISDYKKLLQGFIWKERGHARHLADFLLGNGLLTPADLDEARQVAAANERNGICEMARRRLKYRPKAKDHPEA